MPPRVTFACTPSTIRKTLTAARTSSFPFSFIKTTTQQTRSASILGTLSDTKGSYNKNIRRGRGPSSGKGKTSGRGHKGQKQHGKVPAGFNGGQTKDEVVAGKRGFDNQFSLNMSKINLDRIQSWIDQGRLDITKPITLRELHKSRCTHGIKDGLKLLARNATELRSPIHITVSRASAAAIAAVEAAGGTVQTRYYTKSSIGRILQGETHPTLSLLSQPSPSMLGLATSAPETADSSSATSASQLPHTTAFPTSDSSTSIPSMPSNDSTYAHTALLAAIQTYRYRLPDPAQRKDLEYYRDPAHRGYLSYQLREGQGPSLFFRTPGEVKEAGSSGGKRRVKGRLAQRSDRLF